MKTIQEQIEVMQHFANGGEVEYSLILGNNYSFNKDPQWDWTSFDYRIKEQEKTITIEKWLCEYNNCEELKGSNRFFIIEKAFPFEIGGKKVKLIESYEVEL